MPQCNRGLPQERVCHSEGSQRSACGQHARHLVPGHHARAGVSTAALDHSFVMPGSMEGPPVYSTFPGVSWRCLSSTLRDLLKTHSPLPKSNLK